MHQFEVIRELGTGSFGRVLKVRRKEDMNLFAMKTIKFSKLNAKEKDNALNEVRLLASIDAPNIIKYKGAFFQQGNNTLSIVMQFADGGDLTGLIQKKIAKNERFDENFIWKVAHDLLQGLKTLHQGNIIHRDIKSANVFFVNGIAKLGDLNVSKVMQGNFATTQTGTPYYTSPQIWSGKKYTQNCDIWSLGCVLYQLCSLRPPFMAKDFPGLMKRVTAGYYDPISSRYSKKLSMLIRKCLTVDHKKRSTACDLLETDVFMMMMNEDDGQVELLETIRCPRVLKLIHKQLPQDQYVKKPKTLKLIVDESIEQQRNNSSFKNNVPGSMKNIGSEKNIRYYSKDARSKSKQNGLKINMDHKMKIAPVQSPHGYVKLPKVPSYKLII